MGKSKLSKYARKKREQSEGRYVPKKQPVAVNEAFNNDQPETTPSFDQSKTFDLTRNRRTGRNWRNNLG